MRRLTALCASLVLFSTLAAHAQTGSNPQPHDATYIVPSFKFEDGQTLQNLRLHYVTFGTPQVDRSGRTTNAVLIMHGTGGSTKQFLRPAFAGVLFVPGGLLDARKYYIIIPDGIGHGQSSKPSDGLRAKFPHYDYHDMVRAQHELVTAGLHVNHLRLVMGTSMGGMQTWMWGEMYPGMMDALMPLASLPIEISGRNRIWRDMAANAIVSDPAYDGGDYTSEPHAMREVADLLWMVGSAPVYDQRIMPTGAAADAYFRSAVVPLPAHYDANDMLYAIRASRDYNPEPLLGTIRAPLFAVNSADDQINPPSLKIMEREIARVKRGRYILLPISPQTRGHGTHTLPRVWGSYLDRLLRISARPLSM
jgi:homoserine O-acetyltransferase